MVAGAERRHTDPASAEGLPTFLLGEARDDRLLRPALVLALAVHLGLLLTPPPRPKVVSVPPSQASVFLLQQPRFKPPERRSAPPQRQVRKVPIPDLIPDILEPLPRPEEDPGLFELSDPGAILGIPDAPPSWGQDGPLELGAGISPPVRLHGPHPLYAEAARRGGLQGVVVLRTIVDQEGEVTVVEVLKDLPLGLGASAVETVGTWRYRPATLDGRPVAVYLTVTVQFSLSR